MAAQHRAAGRSAIGRSADAADGRAQPRHEGRAPLRARVVQRERASTSIAATSSRTSSRRRSRAFRIPSRSSSGANRTAAPSSIIFNRVDRTPRWAGPRDVETAYPVVAIDDAPVTRALIEQIQASAAGGRFAAFDTTIDGDALSGRRAPALSDDARPAAARRGRLHGQSRLGRAALLSGDPRADLAHRPGRCRPLARRIGRGRSDRGEHAPAGEAGRRAARAAFSVFLPRRRSDWRLAGIDSAGAAVDAQRQRRGQPRARRGRARIDAHAVADRCCRRPWRSWASC